MTPQQLEKLLTQVKTGEIAIEQAIGKLRHLPFEDLGYAKVDHHRQMRCGWPEVIYCPGKTNEQIVEIFGKLANTGNNVLASRAEPEVYKAIQDTNLWPEATYETQARAVILRQRKTEPAEGFIAIVSAGTADGPIAAEAEVTAKIMDQNVKSFHDVGVAGLHRLLGNVSQIQQANVVIVVAGMEGALASVVGGLVSSPVIAVPTSVGYGASFQGLSALLTMLNSCASGVVVVNIDNGFSAGYTAAMINEQINTAGRKQK